MTHSLFTSKCAIEIHKSLLLSFISAPSTTTKNTYKPDSPKKRERNKKGNSNRSSVENQPKLKKHRGTKKPKKDTEASIYSDYCEKNKVNTDPSARVMWNTIQMQIDGEKTDRRPEVMTNKTYKTRPLMRRLSSTLEFPLLPKAEGLNLFPVLNSSLATFHVKYQTFQYHSEESTVAHPV